MHPLGTRNELHLQWGAIVDGNVERLWRLAISAGLPRREAAEVCQVAWLRLSQRLAEFSTVDQVTRWLDEQVCREVGALLRRSERRPATQLADQAHQPADPDSDYRRRADHDLGAATAIVVTPPF